MYEEYSLKERLLALLLSAVLVLGMMPINQASATEIFGFEQPTPAAISYTEGATFDNPASGGEGNGAVTYAILSGGDVANIDSQTGTLTILAPGTVTVQAVKEADGDVQEQTAEYTLEITQPVIPPFSFAEETPADLEYEDNLTFHNVASGGAGSGAVRYALLTKNTEAGEEPSLIETTETDIASIDTETGELTIRKAGTVTVRAKKAADGDIPEQIISYTLQIKLGEQTSFVFAEANPTQPFFEAFSYTNAVSGGESTGNVTYAITGGTGVADINADTGEVTNVFQVGTIIVTATKAADEKYQAATASYTLTITKGTQTGFVFADPEPAPVVRRDHPTYSNTASGGEGGGKITYAITSGEDVATINTDTGELSILKYGTITVTATKAGDDKYDVVTATYTLEVTKVPQTGFAFEKLTPDEVDYAENLTFTNKASGGEGSGAVTYTIIQGDDIAAVDENGNLTISGHGTVTVEAVKAEDDTYAEAKATYTLVIRGWQQAALTFQTAEPEVQAYQGAGMTYQNAATGGSGTGALTYAITTGQDIASIATDGTLTINGKGTIVVVATKAADNAYEKATATYTLVVAEPQDAFRFEEENPVIGYYVDGTYQQEPIGGSGDGAVTYEILSGWNVATLNSVQTGELTIKESGKVVIKAVKAADGTYAATKATYTLTVEKAEQSGFGFAATEAEITYNDNENRYELNAAGGQTTGTVTYAIVNDGDVAELTSEGNALNILKAGTVEVKATKPGDDCYQEATATFTLTVKKADQTISFEKDTVTAYYGMTRYEADKNPVTMSEKHSSVAPVYEIIGDNTIGATIDAATGVLSFVDSDAKVGSIRVRVTKGEDDCYNACYAEYAFHLRYADAPETAYTLSGETKNNSGWFTGDVTISAADGYLISGHNLLSTSDWADTITCGSEGLHEGYTVYLKNKTTGSITDGILVTGLHIDKTKPVNLDIQYEKATWLEVLGSIFGFSKETVKVSFTAEDLVSGIAIVEYSKDGGITFERIEETAGTYSISIPAQYRNKVVLKVTDVAGNVTTTLEEQNQDKTLVVDDIPPVIQATFSGEYVYNAEDKIYYTGRDVFAITFTVTDDNYDLRAANPVVMVNGSVRDLQWTSDAQSGKAVLNLPDDGHYTITADFTDRSGNVAEQYSTTICVDKKAPERTVTFNTPSRVVDNTTMTDVSDFTEGAAVVAYYNADVTATVEITEANFRAKDATITVNGNPVTAVQWTSLGNDKYRTTVTLTDEGDYVIAVEYQDRAQNDMPRYQSQRIVIDKTKPVVSVAYENDDVKHTIENRDYFAQKQTATITIQEHNFRADDVAVLVSAKDVVGTDVLTLNQDGVVEAFANQGVDRNQWTPYAAGTWRNENDTYQLTLEFDADANYTFDVTYTDLATNQAADYAEDAFTVDKTAPTNLEISYSDAVLEETVEGVTYAYYKDKVTVTVSAEDATSGVQYFLYSYLNGEGVSSVNAQLLNQGVEAVREGAKGTATFQIPKDALTENNQFNGTVTFQAVDFSENSESKADTKRIVVDNRKPTIQVTYNDPIQQTVDGVAFYGGTIMGEIEITEANFFSEDVVVTVTKDGSEYATNVTVAWTDQSVDIHTGTFELAEGGHYVVSVAYTDKSGNQMEPYTSQELVLDTEPPVDLDISYGEYDDGENHYPNWVQELFKVFYYNKPVTVTITATDTTSGMEGIALNVTKNGSEGATTVQLPKDLFIRSNGSVTGDKGAIKDIQVAYENGKMTVTCRIPEQFRGSLDIVAKDMSHNEASYRDSTIVVVDTIAPKRTVTFKPDRIVKCGEKNELMKDVESFAEGEAVVLYFRKDAVATFAIQEANFHESDIVIKVNDEPASITDWVNAEGDTWCGTLTLAEEGDYVITATYRDRARNEMVPYTSQRIVVDKTAPVITTQYSNTNVRNTIGGRAYLDAQQTVTITIQEHNFRADDVVIQVSAKNVEGRDVLTLNQDGTVAVYEAKGKDRTAWTAYKEGTWRNDGDTYELTLTFSEDANYTFDVEYVDLATNRAKDYAADAFTVDKTPPTNLSISYSESVLETILNAITFGFYNAQMTVTIQATDETSGIYYFVYSYLNAPNVSGVNAELSNEKIPVSNNGRETSATFQIPKAVLSNNNQFNGNVTFTAYDRSENHTGLSDTKRIVVDNISPNATITYNNAVRIVEDISYYNQEIVCTIDINEANFYSDDVRIAVTKDGVAYDVRAAWTNEGADRNTGTFTLTEDGEYVITIAYTDKSGNQMVTYTSDRHTMDTTHPTINVSNIKANSANKDPKYGFVIDIADINLDALSMQPVLTAVLKDENGVYAVQEIELGDPATVEEGRRYTYTVEDLPEDALYTLTCVALDMAQNETREMILEDGEAYEEVTFSINRKGSIFAYGDAFTENLVGQYYVYSVDENVKIVEVNVDPIENYVVKVNGKELSEGVDYTTTQTSHEGEWSRRVYSINKDVFKAEGEYNIIVSSVDKADTAAFSDIKNLIVTFVVDQTKPVVTITGMETGGRYQTDEQTVILIPTDDGGRLNLLRIEAFDSAGNPLKNPNGEDISVRFEMSGTDLLQYLEENDGKVTFTIPEGLNNQVRVICSDCAVNANQVTNTYDVLFERVTVSQNQLVIFYANKPLFYTTVAGVMGTGSAVGSILVKRKRGKYTRK